MELRHLRCFVAVAELGSVSRAAEKLFIAQPPLSATIRQHEDELGVALFVRLPRGVRPTAAGEAFLDDARAILLRAQQAGVRAREKQAGHQSTVRIAVVPSVIHSLLPGLLQRIRAGRVGPGRDERVSTSRDERVGTSRDERVGASLEVREMITSRQLRALRDGEIDFGIARPDSDELPAQVVSGIDDPYCLAVPKGHPLARDKDAAKRGHAGPVQLKRAQREAFVGFSRFQDRDYFDRTLALCLEAGFTPDVRHDANGFTNVLSMVACGLGVAIVPASCALPATKDVVVRRIQGSRYRSRLAIVRSAERPPEAVVERVTALAVGELAKLGAKIRP
jgi:DNA-binding transcriptional LysR family regulator